jgi:hypothetical protein
MAIHKRPIQHLAPVVRKIASLVSRFRKTRRPKYLLLNICDLEQFVQAYALYEKEMDMYSPKIREDLIPRIYRVAKGSRR